MPVPKIKVPKYRLHRARNLAAVTIRGQHVYLGSYGSPESHERYRQLVADLIGGSLDNPKGNQPPADSSTGSAGFTINGLIAEYLPVAEKRYSDDEGKTTTEFACVVSALKQLSAVFGSTAVAEFGPKRLKQLRHHMVGLDWSINTINKAVMRVRRMFKWAVEDELIQPAIDQALRNVPCLTEKNSEAKRARRVQPVAWENVEAIFPFVAPQIADMIRVQWFTGMRPGEVCQMRPCDIDRSGDVWVYQPARHKNEWRGEDRTVYLGPQTQEVLARYLSRSDQAYVFSPIEAEAERHRRQRENRRSKLTPSQKARHPKANPVRQPRNCYDSASYRRAITRGIKAANKARGDEEVKVVQWHPNQVRHSKGTTTRAQFGLEAAQVTLGHKNADVTQIYAETDRALAVRIARETG